MSTKSINWSFHLISKEELDFHVLSSLWPMNSVDVKLPTTTIIQMSNKLNKLLLCFISLLLFISSGCNFRLHLFLNIFLFCDKNYLKLGYYDKNKDSPLLWKLRFFLSHIRWCYIVHVDHTGSVKPHLREIELLMRFNCWSCW